MSVGLFSFDLAVSFIAAWLAVRLVVSLMLKWRTSLETVTAAAATTRDKFTIIQ